ncbi:helix-turn-helix domain-containing protein [Eubacteriales bacterium OttesenSCG-928-M02]|nr:helix-turn-helix domain-containing protein [Eubacteriales bacterium OttesenSCG-928-M02]
MRLSRESTGKILRKYRAAAGLTQCKAAELIESNVPTLWRYEHGERMPNLDTMQRIARVYDFSLDAFVEDVIADQAEK